MILRKNVHYQLIGLINYTYPKKNQTSILSYKIKFQILIKFARYF